MELTHGGSRAAVVANATDVYSPDDRTQAVASEQRALAELGFRTEELDLRKLFDTDGIEDTIRSYDLVWVRGGDTWTLRYSMARSGADVAIRRLLADDDVVYGGYSAGSCVLGPTLEGIEGVDDPNWLKRLYGVDPIWEGLSVLDFCIVPHVNSPQHPESEACDRLAEVYRASGTPHQSLRDGDVLIVDGETQRHWTA